MKTVFFSVNSKFVHTLLAPRYLVAGSTEETEIFETNINVKLYENLAAIYKIRPDVIAVSCYIFNAEYVIAFMKEIRKLLPDVIIIAGGYEAQYDTENYLLLADYILCGEGDVQFGKLLSALARGEKPENRVIECGEISDLSALPSPYTDEYLSLGKDRILYYESSRGCPFSCAYCMSSLSHGVRFFPLERVFSELKRIASFKVKQLKFVDRTFNCDKKRAAEIVAYVCDELSDYGTSFHFETAPELFDERLFEALSKAKKGLIRIEIGVQSYNEKALEAVNRSENAALADANIKRLAQMKNLTLHTDLIAGLPDEDLASFISGFDRLFMLFPSELQLGFLKVLKGSRIEKEHKEIKYFSAPPYEVISTPCLSFSDIVELKTAEEMLELYYNSGRFPSSIRLLTQNFFAPYDLFIRLGRYYARFSYTVRSASAHAQCDLLYYFTLEHAPTAAETVLKLIKADYAASGNVREWKPHITTISDRSDCEL